MTEKVSIIMVSYNAVKTIEQTILSVIQQTYENIEYIIIDGGSTDGTVDIIKKYQDNIGYWVSEPDRGIYDAMNKGIDIATGAYIYFLGADDSLVDREIIAKVALKLDKNIDVLCGCVYVVEKEKHFLQLKSGTVLTKDNVLDGRMTPHQGMFVKTELMKGNKFDLRYKIGADFDFFLKLHFLEKKIIYIDEVIAFFSTEGISGTNTKLICKDFIQILSKYKIPKERLVNIEKRFTQNPIKKVLKFLLKKFGCIELIKINIYHYEKHLCKWEKCRWCSERAVK
ncbi:glycosyltransferase family 2 protein [Anaerosinus massiliensis]|uniref:glycosyltransferase family 2 protein n=1 Tax=Massilibacillus massiliensis TaxID=1806837 RepID=UPI000A8C4E92|nr:glycosyltransferase family 2 protein [Massilibacillus massiliensis]